MLLNFLRKLCHRRLLLRNARRFRRHGRSLQQKTVAHAFSGILSPHSIEPRLIAINFRHNPLLIISARWRPFVPFTPSFAASVFCRTCYLGWSRPFPQGRHIFKDAEQPWKRRLSISQSRRRKAGLGLVGLVFEVKFARCFQVYPVCLHPASANHPGPQTSDLRSRTLAIPFSDALSKSGNIELQVPTLGFRKPKVRRPEVRGPRSEVRASHSPC